MIQTDRYKKVLQLAEEESNEMGNNHLGTEHILFALARHGTGQAILILKELGIELDYDKIKLKWKEMQ